MGRIRFSLRTKIIMLSVGMAIIPLAAAMGFVIVRLNALENRERSAAAAEASRVSSASAVRAVSIGAVLEEASGIARSVDVFLIVALFFAVGAGVLFSRRLIRSVGALEEGLAQLSVGNLDYRVSVATKDEMRHLADSFNGMAEKFSHAVSAMEGDAAKIASQRDVAATEIYKLDSVLSGVTDAVVAIDAERNVLFMNHTATAMTGFGAEEAVGHPVRDVFRIFSADAELPFERYCPEGEDISEGKATIEQGVRMLSGRGRISAVDLVARKSVLGLESGPGYVVTFRSLRQDDIAERMKNEFVSVVAHQLRTPLTGIKWSLRSILDQKRSNFSDIEKAYVSKAYSSAERMVGLVSDLLDVSRMEQGRFVYKPVLANVGQIVESVAKLAKPVAEERRIKLTLKKSRKDPPQMRVDIQAIRLVFQNLIENAIKYTQPGGSVNVSLDPQEEELRVTVADTGIGVDSSDQDKVFDKFYRGSDAMRTDPSGSGLGLYITKNIIEAHGGKIWFDSQKGRGTVFTVSLPAVS